MKKTIITLLAIGSSINAFAVVGDSNSLQTPRDNIISAYATFLAKMDGLGLTKPTSEYNLDIKNIILTTGKKTAINDNFNNINKISAYLQKSYANQTIVYDTSVIFSDNNGLSNMSLTEHNTVAFGMGVSLEDIANNTIYQKWQNIKTIDSSAKFLTKVIIEKSVFTKKVDYVFVYSTEKPNKDSMACSAYEFDFKTGQTNKLDDKFNCF